MKRFLVFLIACFAGMAVSAQQMHWTPVDAGLYSESTTVIAVVKINGVEQQSSQMELAVFCGNECRGTAMTAEFPPTHRYLAMVNVYGEDGHILTFKAYNHATSQELVMNPVVNVEFTENGSGTLSEPLEVSFVPEAVGNIEFADANVKAICVANWDTNGDGELSYAEAEAVTSLSYHFKGNTSIVSFNELQFFTGLTALNGYTHIGTMPNPNHPGPSTPHIGTGITYYGEFLGCNSLASITIPYNVSSVGTNVFSGCQSLASMTVKAITPPSTVVAAFTNVDKSIPVYVPAGTVEAYQAATGWSEFINIQEDLSEAIVFADANVKALCVANWDTNGDGELSYAEAAAVTDLGTVFKNNYSITSFDELQYFTGLTEIGYQTFAWCMNLQSIQLPGTITSIGNSALYDCRSLLSITIPASVTSIGSSALSCDNLETIVVEAGNTVYDSRDNCNAIIVTSTNTLFRGCKNTVIPNDVVALATNSFSSCNMESLSIPASVASIDYTAFHACQNLSEITVDAANEVFDSRDNCNAIINMSTNKLIVGSKITVIPNTVTAIGSYAFSYRFNNGSHEITIPESVTLIENNAYLGGTGITSITVYATVPPTLDSDAFQYVPTGIPVYVPYGTLAAYQAAAGWSDFTNYHEMEQPGSVCHWTPVEGYLHNMTVVGIVVIDDVPMDDQMLELGAFCNNECRGAVLPIEEEFQMRYFMLMSGETGDAITFRLYNHSTNQELELNCVSTLQFVVDAIIEPYEFTFVSDTPQLTPLTTGWNWYSTYIEQANNNCLPQLQQSLGSYGIMIKNNAAFTRRLSSGNWNGTLTSIDNAKGYKINMKGPVNSLITGTLADPADHPITIKPNWNWIGYPVSVEQSVTTALAGFTPSNGDILKGQGGFTTYRVNRWMPNTFTMVPGQMYLYYSKSTENKTLTFANPREEYVAIEKPELHWKADIHGYPDNICVMAVVNIDGVEQRDENLELAAFVNGECRGNCKLFYVDDLDRYIAFLTVTGEDGDVVAFACNNGERTINGAKSIVFHENDVIGDLDNPFELSFGMYDVEDDFISINIYPNPVTSGEDITVALPYDEKISEIVVTNVLGMTVHYEKGTTNTIKGIATSGVYNVMIINNEGAVYRGKIVVK